MTVSDDSIDTSIWTDVRTLIVSAGLAVTNSTTGVVTNASINSIYNDKEPQRPQIIIHPIIIDEDYNKFGGVEGFKEGSIIIDCYAKDTLGIDQLSQGVRNTIKNNVISGIDIISVNQDVAFTTSGEQKYLLKTLSYSFQRE